MPNYTKAKRTAQKKRNVLFVSAEVFPFTGSSDLADITNGLPLALEELGNEMRIMMPKYGNINDRIFRIHDVLRLKEVSIPHGKGRKSMDVKVTALPASKTQTYFLYNEEYFKRHGIYADSKTQKAFEDNDQRFIFFCRGVFEVLKVLGWKPDIIHCNDWISGLVPMYLKLLYKNDPFFENVKCVYTVHSLHNQGEFDKKSMAFIGLPEDEKTLLIKNKLNFIQLGITHADVVTTLSPSYASEISIKGDKSFLELLKSKKKKIIGISNGLSNFSWEPIRDRMLKKRFSIENVTQAKLDNKTYLFERLKMDTEASEPLLIVMGELSEHKGMELIEKALPPLLKKNVKVIIAGMGEQKYEKYFANLELKFGHKFKFLHQPKEDMQRQLYASANMLLMPSKIEPGGINHFKMMKYGGIPIVHWAGGLKDIIISLDKKDGNGFVFDKFVLANFQKAIEQALAMYAKKDVWEKTIHMIMAKSYPWLDTAKVYDDIYNKISTK